MRITRTLALTTAAALVAGAGLAAAVPAANAAPKAPKFVISGTTSIVTAKGLAPALMAEGIAVFAIAPGTSSINNTKGDLAAFQFPISAYNPAKKTVNHKGGLLFANLKAGGTIDCRTPQIDLAGAVINCTLAGPTGDVTAPALKLTNVSKPVVKKVGKVTTTTIKATISVNGDTVATILNNALKTTMVKGNTVLGTGVVAIKSTQVG